MIPFRIEIASDQIQDLNKRLSNTRWPDEIANSQWDYGTNLSYLKELCSYWNTNFDWAVQELFLNQFNHFKASVDNQDLHFIYEKGRGIKNLPLVLIHGWPDSFYRFIKLIPMLTEPDENGTAFDVIIPSIPGFGFSAKPVEPGMSPAKIASLFNRLITDTLRYNAFAIHGGDWGASIATQMVIQKPEKITRLHLTNVPPELFYTSNIADFNEAEISYLQASGQYQKQEGAYLAIQSTKPQTIAYGLNDSPSGLAGWIIEKFNKWSDNHGHIENSFTKDELLTNLSIYWFTQTAGSAGRIYYEAMRQPHTMGVLKISVPTYFAIFSADSIQIPESFARRTYNVKSWSKIDKGGHFAALETPELLVRNIRAALASS